MGWSAKPWGRRVWRKAACEGVSRAEKACIAVNQYLIIHSADQYQLAFFRAWAPTRSSSHLQKPESAIIFIMAENEFKTHPSSEKMKFLLADQLKNASKDKATARTLQFDDSAYLLSLSGPRHADLHVMNPTFTAVSQSKRITEVAFLSCCTSITKDNHFIFIYASRNAVTVLKFDQSSQGFEPATELAKAEYQFEADDGFKVLTSPFRWEEGERILAYSEKDEFYLISLSERGRDVKLQISKIVDEDRPNGIWSWLSRQRAAHYESISIVPFESQQSKQLRILCVRDNTAAVFRIAMSVSIKEQSRRISIKQLYACMSLPSAISPDSALLSAHLVSQRLALLAYSLKERVCLVKLSIVEEEASMTFEKINTRILSTSFQILRCRQHFYFNFYDTQTYRHKCLKFPQDLKELKKNFEDIEPVFEAPDLIWLCGNKKKLLLIHAFTVFVLDEESNENLPEQVKKYKAFKRWVEGSFDKKIKKQMHQKDYSQLSKLLDEKEDKLTEQYSHLRKSGIEAGVEEGITRDILCAHIVKKILSFRDYFRDLLNYLEHPNLRTQLSTQSQESLVENMITLQAVPEIQCFLTFMVKMEMIEYLNEILEEISKHPLRDVCRETISAIFCEVCSSVIHKFRGSNNKNLSTHKILMQFTFNLIKVDEASFTNDFLYLADECSTEEATFVCNLVLNAKLSHIFMHLFTNSRTVEFSAEEVKEVVTSLDEPDQQLYLDNFFHLLRHAYNECDRDDPFRTILANRAATLIRAVAKDEQLIENILQETFPGFNAYLYIKSDRRQEHSQRIIEIGRKCTNPNIAYMLLLAAPGDDRKHWRQELARIRLWCDLKLEYSDEQDILKNIEEGKHDQATISQKKWEEVMQILEIPTARAAQMAQHLILTP